MLGVRSILDRHFHRLPSAAWTHTRVTEKSREIVAITLIEYVHQVVERDCIDLGAGNSGVSSRRGEIVSSSCVLAMPVYAFDLDKVCNSLLPYDQTTGHPKR